MAISASRRVAVLGALGLIVVLATVCRAEPGEQEVFVQPGDPIFAGLAEGERHTAFPPNPPFEPGVEDSGREPLPPPEASEHYQVLQQALQEAQKRDVVCDTPFGTRLGVANGVAGYSNCNTAHVSQETNEYTVVLRGDEGEAKVVHPTGIKYQCVEYARRYLFHHHHVVFPDVMGAVDIWRLTSVHVPHDENTRFHLGRYRNYDDADRIPAIGSMIIYPIQEDMPFGHVAIVVGVKMLPTPSDRKLHDEAQEGPRHAAILQIAEQNFDSHEWRYQTHSREIHLDTRDGEYYAVHDPHYRTFGWMTVEKDIKPLDAFLHDEEEPGLPPGHTHRVDPADL